MAGESTLMVTRGERTEGQEMDRAKLKSNRAAFGCVQDGLTLAVLIPESLF